METFSAAEIEGDSSENQEEPIGALADDVVLADLPDIDFDDGESRNQVIPICHSSRISEDRTNLHRHAKANAQEAVALAKQRAQQFDTQAALERKTNEALKLAKAQAHIRDDTDDMGEPSGKAPLVDRVFLSSYW